MTRTARFVFLALACASLAACASHEAIPLPPPPSPGEPAQLIGLTPPKLRYVFGAPAFMRKDGTAELWRYDGASCKAFFFLYQEEDSLEVRHVETLPHGKQRAADATCLDALRVTVSPPVS